MSQITITTTDQAKTEELIQYLGTLDYVEVKLIEPDQATKEEAIARTRKFLSELPEVPYREQNVVDAIKAYRKSKSYK